MDLYTLTDQFLAKDVIDEYVSAIWTERYSTAGEVQLVLPSTSENLEKLKDGTFLALRGTREVMELQTQSIENRMMTVVGNTLVGFLNERLAWFKNENYGSGTDQTLDKITDYSDKTRVVGAFLADVVNKMVILPVPFTGSTFTPVNLDWEYEVIDNLELGAVDTSGTAERLTIPIGPLYDGIAQLALKGGVGISLYLDTADEVDGYILKFTTYRGKDRTTGSAYPLVRLTPEMDSLTGIKEVRSRANWKNVCYVYYKGVLSVHYEDSAAPKPEGFERRILVTDAVGEPVGHKVERFGPYYGWPSTVVGPEDEAVFREQNAKDALANHNYIRALDGQTSPVNEYKYGVDYGLGDVIELEGLTGTISKARITEYIRSEDKSGEKEYPTISVIGGE